MGRGRSSSIINNFFSNKSKPNTKINTDNNSNSIGKFGGLSFLSGAITTNTCSSDDESFYCKLSRGYNSVSMIVNLFSMFFVFCVILLFVYRFFLNRKISKKH